MCSSTSGIGTDENDSENDDMKKMNQRRERKMMTRIRMRMRNQSPTMACIREGIDNPQMLPLFFLEISKKVHLQPSCFCVTQSICGEASSSQRKTMDVGC